MKTDGQKLRREPRLVQGMDVRWPFGRTDAKRGRSGLHHRGKQVRRNAVEVRARKVAHGLTKGGFPPNRPQQVAELGEHERIPRLDRKRADERNETDRCVG
jgi:hypothetical protein